MASVGGNTGDGGRNRDDHTPTVPTFPHREEIGAAAARPSLDTIPLSATDRSLTSAYPQPESLTPSVPNMYRSASASSQSPLHTPQAGYDSEVGNGVRGYDFAADPRDGPYGGAIMGGQGGNQTGTTTSSSTSRVHYQEPADSNHPFNIAQTAQEQRYTTVPLGPPSGAIENEKRGKKRNNGMFSGVFTKSSASSPESEKTEQRGRPTNPRALSWDRLTHQPDHSTATSEDGTQTPKRRGAKTPDWEGFDFNTAHSSVEQLRFAEGDVGTSKLAKSYYYLLSKSIITRWFLYIFPILVLLWVPGIVWLAGVKSAAVWSVPLLYWSIWLSVVWVGWWAALAVSMMLPKFVGSTLGAVVPGLRTWVEVATNLVRVVAFIAWALAIWVSFTPIVINQYNGDQTANSRSNLTTMASLLFGLFLSSLVVGAEKLMIQIIAYRFHQDSYADRIVVQKEHVRALVTLYINSHEISGRNDTLKDNATVKKGAHAPRLAMRRALKGLRNAAQSTTTVIGNVATEMTGQSVLQTNSPYNRVTTALSSASKTKQLARRLYYSFRQPDRDHVRIDDIARFFPNLTAAQEAFAAFDRDDNGDATRDEIEMACMQLHREKMSLEASMKDLDGAVRRLDDIFMVIVLLIVILIMAAMITNKLTTLVTSAGTFVLGLSWLIGTTMQEILGACIFLFVKHPFDVGDRVDIDGNSYVVSSMQLMSTTFKRVDGTYTFVGNFVLKDKYIYNIRRSGPIAETFVFEVDFVTTFEKLQELRSRMLKFLKAEGRDFMQIFDVIVDDLPAQGKMVLKADIKYKTNWQEGALKVQRRNKWICALKTALADCQIWGPAGAGNPTPDPVPPVEYTLVPYSPPALPATGSREGVMESPPPDFQSATSGGNHGAALVDRQQVIADPSGEIFDDEGTDTGSIPNSGVSTPYGVPSALRQRPHGVDTGESIEMTPARRRM